MGVPVVALREFRQRLEGVWRRGVSVLEQTRVGRKLIDIWARLSLISVSAQVICPERIDKNINDIEPLCCRIGRLMQTQVLLLPIFDVLRGQRPSDAVVVNAVANNLRMTRVDVFASIIAVASTEKLRVPISIEIENPLRELEVLFGLSGSIEDLSLQTLVLIEASKSENH